MYLYIGNMRGAWKGVLRSWEEHVERMEGSVMIMGRSMIFDGGALCSQ